MSTISPKHLVKRSNLHKSHKAGGVVSSNHISWRYATEAQLEVRPACKSTGHRMVKGSSPLCGLRLCSSVGRCAALLMRRSQVQALPGPSKDLFRFNYVQLTTISLSPKQVLKLILRTHQSHTVWNIISTIARYRKTVICDNHKITQNLSRKGMGCRTRKYLIKMYELINPRHQKVRTTILAEINSL